MQSPSCTTKYSATGGASASRRLLSRRRVLEALGVTGVTALVGACSSGQPAVPVSGSTLGPVSLPTVTASPVPGKLLIVGNGNLRVFDLSALQSHQLTYFPQGAYAASPALSWDRARIVYTYYVIPKNEQTLGGSDLYTVDADGKNPKLLQKHGAPGATYEVPCWSADDKAVFATHRVPLYDAKNQYQGESLAVHKVSLDGTAPISLVESAMSPAASPDGKFLAYIPTDKSGQGKGISVGDADGKNGKPILDKAGFSLVNAPCFAPDSARIAFAAVGGPRTAGPSARSAPAPDAEFSFRLPFAPAVAEAHGIPWDIWTVHPDGSGLTQLTRISEDTPVPIWSPDGKWIAIAGEIGVYLVDAQGKQTLRLSTAVSAGGIGWLS